MELIIYCPGCAEPLEGSRSRIRRDLNFKCTDCGIRIWIQGHRGIHRFIKIRQGQAVFYKWVVCDNCHIAVNQDRLKFNPSCPGCDQILVHGLDGYEGYSEEELDKWKS